eukprot:TRINITY_DN4545_c0_g2_i1.p1 TRINITY_DN4545_c0_g2~~TRINITY_DN4545_c0_g2_i1.p1  ORF type:complete len:459 (-),score=57.24 TRINITY_DN4545_c0_g2_i1:2-1378(-)
MDAVFISLLDFVGFKAECLLAEPNISYSEIFRRFWILSTGETFESANSQWAKPKLIVVDETQMIYSLGADNEFWMYIKNLQQRAATFKSRVVFIAAYGTKPTARADALSTPVAFNRVHGLEYLRFTKEELSELIGLHNTHRGLTIGKITENFLWETTQGHPGFVTVALHKLNERFQDKEVSDTEYLKYLLGSSHIQNLMGCRAVPEVIDKGEQETLKNLLLNPKVKKEPKQDCHNLLLKAGILALTQDGENVQLSAPVMATILLNRIFSPQQPHSGGPSDVDSFVMASLSEFDVNTLRNSYSRGTDGKPLEALWNAELYRTANKIIDRCHIVSCDVGAALGSTGFIDIFVNGSLMWGFELLREGKDLKGHIDRFGDGGIYEPMGLGKKIVIDFRRGTPKSKLPQIAKKASLSGVLVYRVLYNDDYSRLTVQTNGQNDRVVHLIEPTRRSLPDPDVPTL